jgi:hypothetical protein
LEEYAIRDASPVRSQALQVEGEPPFNQDGVVEPEWDNAFGQQDVLVKMNRRSGSAFQPVNAHAQQRGAVLQRLPGMFYKESRGRNYFRTGRDETAI